MATAEHHQAQHAEHFESYGKQLHAARLGMWIFLGSETLLFAALFGLYTGFRTMYAAEFLAASHHNNVLIGTGNTLILITSSFAVAWAVHSLRHDRRRVAMACLGITMLFGLMFLGLKGYEYADHFSHGIYPGAHYEFAELPGHGAQLFFTMYYIMTGLHALHVIAGLVLLALALVLIWRRRVTPDRYSLLENAGLYWHLVDVIWIFLWPLLYLAG